MVSVGEYGSPYTFQTVYFHSKLSFLQIISTRTQIICPSPDHSHPIHAGHTLPNKNVQTQQ